MKRTLLFLFMTVFALSFNSCSSDDDNNNGGDTGNTVKLTAVFRQQSNGVENPLPGTMYIFKLTKELSGYDYNSDNHTFKLSDGTILKAAYTLKMNENGAKEEWIDKNTKYVYSFEPDFDHTKYSIDRFETKEESITIMKVR